MLVCILPLAVLLMVITVYVTVTLGPSWPSRTDTHTVKLLSTVVYSAEENPIVTTAYGTLHELHYP